MDTFMQKSSDARSKAALKLWDWLAPTLGSAGTALGMDMISNPDKSLFEAEDWDKKRIANTVLNLALGGIGGRGIQGKLAKDVGTSITTGLGAIALAPTKDLAINLLDVPNKVNESLEKADVVMEGLPEKIDEMSALHKGLGIGAGILGLGALGLGGIALLKKLREKKDGASKDKGTIKYRIPGKANDPRTDTIVELPIGSDMLSPALMEDFGTNIRRQARKNIKANMRKKDPTTGKLISLQEYEAKYGPIKEASASMLERGLTEGSPSASVIKVEEPSHSTIEAFYKFREQQGYNDNTGTTVKLARAFHEGAGTIATGLLGAGLGAAGGRLLSEKLEVNPLLSMIGGAILGGVTPAALGTALASLQEKERDADVQIKHDKGSPLAEYLIPGYGAYQAKRRINGEAKAMQIAGKSFAATGANPLPPQNGVSLTDAAVSDSMLDEDAEDYDALSKYASQGPPPGDPSMMPPPPPPPSPGQGGTTVPPDVNQTAEGLSDKKPKGDIQASLAKMEHSLNTLRMRMSMDMNREAADGVMPPPDGVGMA